MIRRPPDSDPGSESPDRWAWAETDPDAIAHNVRVLIAAAAPAEVWAVVKADGYGHGAETVARAALGAGAAGLCVALVQEGVALRRAGVQAPILVLSEQPVDQLADLVAHRLIPTVSSVGTIAPLVAAVGANRFAGYKVHVKVDTGMHRAGTDVENAAALLEAIAATDGALHVAGLFTHLATSDQPDHPANRLQLDRFQHVVDAARTAGHAPDLIHAANSAAALAIPEARFDLVRVGIAMYGISPGDQIDDLASELRPALSLRARVSRVARVPAGEGVSYGWRRIADSERTVATVPIGYADGVRRQLWEHGEVLIGGRRRPFAGVVTMDQVIVDCGEDNVSVGDEVVLLGRQGDEQIRAEEWAELLDTIGYEIVCGISGRIGRREHRR